MNIESSFIGQSPAIKKLRKIIAGAARTKSHIVLSGNHGCGKTTIATLIHEGSSGKGSFVSLNPRSATEEEIKSTLEKAGPRIGTLLFQRIEEFSFLQQSMIADFISNLSKKPSMRVIISSTKDLRQAHEDGEILEALFETVKKFQEIKIPELSARTEDIPLLIDQFIKSACDELEIKPKALDINSLDFLIRREWRENIRELKFIIERSVISSEGPILELPENILDERSQLNGIIENIDKKRSFMFDKSMLFLEKILIVRALEAVSFNQSKAAIILGLTEANLRYRLKKFKIIE